MIDIINSIYSPYRESIKGALLSLSEKQLPKTADYLWLTILYCDYEGLHIKAYPTKGQQQRQIVVNSPPLYFKSFKVNTSYDL